MSGLPVDPQAAEFFNRQMDDLDNRMCCDCGTAGATWVSIQHGIYLSIGAAGLHRSLGVKVSFVQSTTMDSWKPIHLKMMELGGNRRFNDFMKEQGIPADMPIREKYSTRAAAWYRENLKALAEGKEPLAPLPAGTGLEAADPTSPSDTRQLLDQVFAEAHNTDSTTCSTFFQEDDSHEDSKHTSRSFCQKLSDCFKPSSWCSATKKPVPEEAVDMYTISKQLSVAPLPTLLCSQTLTCKYATLKVDTSLVVPA